MAEDDARLRAMAGNLRELCRELGVPSEGAKGHEMVAGCLEATRARQEAVGLVLEDLEEESGRGSLVGADSPSACVTQQRTLCAYWARRLRRAGGAS